MQADVTKAFRPSQLTVHWMIAYRSLCGRVDRRLHRLTEAPENVPVTCRSCEKHAARLFLPDSAVPSPHEEHER